MTGRFTKTEISTTHKTNEDAVDCPTEYIGVVGFGQSNIANRIKRISLYKNIDDAFMWDWTDGKCYVYSEPLIGTDGEERGNLLTDAVLYLKENNIQKPIIVAPMARGGSSVFFWYKGRQKYRLGKFLENALKANLKFDFWLWMQGETDAIPELYVPHKNIAFNSQNEYFLRGEVNDFYAKALNGVFDKVKSDFSNAKFGVSLTSKCKNEGNVYIRKGQEEVINAREDTFFSFDTDSLGDGFRSDGCHFNEKGANIIGTAYGKFVLEHLIP